jgi:hypothetical protein
MLYPVAVERAESEIDTVILKRSREREEANRVETAWALSEARHRTRSQGNGYRDALASLVNEGYRLDVEGAGDK